MNPIPFGKYTLLMKIGTGGMVELFLALDEEGMEGDELQAGNSVFKFCRKPKKG